MSREQHRKSPRREEIYPQSFRSTRSLERPPHVGSLILDRIAAGHMDTYGVTPEHTVELEDSKGETYVRTIFARGKVQDGHRSSLHVIDEYPASHVLMTHIAGRTGLVTFIHATGLPDEQELIIHRSDPSHVRSELERLYDLIECPAQRFRLLDRLDLLKSDDLYPRAYKAWITQAFAQPLGILRTHLNEMTALKEHV